jgi:hypothetical protein
MFVCVYSMFLLSCVCRWRPCDGLIPRSMCPTDYLRIKKLNWNKAFQGCLMLQSGGSRNEKKRRIFISYSVY